LRQWVRGRGFRDAAFEGATFAFGHVRQPRSVNDEWIIVPNLRRCASVARPAGLSFAQGRAGVAVRVKRKLLQVLILVLIFVAGGSIGFGLGKKYGVEHIVPIIDLGTAMYTGMMTAAERLYGTDATYENSLRGYVTLLDNLTARDVSGSLRRIYAADKALSLIRLADLAEKRGASAESTRLTADALAACSTDGLPYCSSAELRQRAQKMDAVFESTGQPR
jgi:hypothetical protein